MAHQDGGHLALTLGASWSFYTVPNHAFQLYFDLVPMFADPTVIEAQWGVAWQFY